MPTSGRPPALEESGGASASRASASAALRGLLFVCKRRFARERERGSERGLRLAHAHERRGRHGVGIQHPGAGEQRAHDPDRKGDVNMFRCLYSKQCFLVLNFPVNSSYKSLTTN